MLFRSALSPAKVISVIADAEEKTAKVVVPDYQLSLAIGKEGQNARLAARLTGFKIDIKSETQAREAGDFMDYENEYEEYEEYEEKQFSEAYEQAEDFEELENIDYKGALESENTDVFETEEDDNDREEKETEDFVEEGSTDE